VHAIVSVRSEKFGAPVLGAICRIDVAARQSGLIARLPRCPHISTYTTTVLHWLLLSSIRHKVVLLVTKSQQGIDTKPAVINLWVATPAESPDDLPGVG